MTTAQRHIIRWDPTCHEWIVYLEATRVGAFSKLYEAEHFACSDAVLDLDEPAEVETP